MLIIFIKGVFFFFFFFFFTNITLNISITHSSSNFYLKLRHKKTIFNVLRVYIIWKHKFLAWKIILFKHLFWFLNMYISWKWNKERKKKKKKVFLLYCFLAGLFFAKLCCILSYSYGKQYKASTYGKVRPLRVW